MMNKNEKNSLKAMPYSVPEGFMEFAKTRNKAIVRAYAEGAGHRRYRVLTASIAAVCVLAAVVVGGKFMQTQQPPTAMERLTAALHDTPTEVLSEIACDYEYYPTTDL